MVTVFTAVFNQEYYIKDAIESVLSQKFEEFEYLIIDDGSTDKTPEILSTIKDPRVRVVRNEENMGLFSTRNKGISLANGEFITLLDSDDLMTTNRIGDQVHFLKSNPEVALVASWVSQIDSEGQELANLKYPKKSEEIRASLMFGNPIAQSSVTIRKKILDQFKYRKDYPPAEDYDLWTRIIQHHRVGMSTNFLTKYRTHSNNISKSQYQKQLESKRKIIRSYLTDYLNLEDENLLNIHMKIIGINNENSLKSDEIIFWSNKLISIFKSFPQDFRWELQKQILKYINKNCDTKLSRLKFYAKLNLPNRQIIKLLSNSY